MIETARHIIYKIDEDIAVVKEHYPYIVKLVSYKALATEEWEFLNKLQDSAILIAKYMEGPVQNVGPITVVYGFKQEDDAVAFKLLFSGV